MIARGWFAIVYRAVTAQVRDGIVAGAYDDGDRMEQFDVRFARYWLDAHAAWDRGERVPASWACSFESRRTARADPAARAPARGRPR